MKRVVRSNELGYQIIYWGKKKKKERESNDRKGCQDPESDTVEELQKKEYAGDTEAPLALVYFQLVATRSARETGVTAFRIRDQFSVNLPNAARRHLARDGEVHAISGLA